MELRIELEKEELEELAKMLYVAQFGIDCGNPRCEYHYPHWDTFEKTLNKINKCLVELIPESGLVEKRNDSQREFTHTVKTENEMDMIIQELLSCECENETLDDICEAVTANEYDEKYGNNVDENGDQIFNETVYDILYEKNMKELKLNRYENLRLR